MKRTLSLFAVLAAVVFAAALLPRPASAASHLVTQQIPWAGATAAAMDSLRITDEADTNFTVPISTAGWAWDDMGKPGPNSTSPGSFNGPILTVVATVSNGVSDSLTALFIPCVATPVGVICGRAVLPTLANSAAILAGAAAVLVVNSLQTYADTKVIFQGALRCDVDAAPGTANVWMQQSFKLCVIGDQGGTTPILAGSRLFISYLQKDSAR